MKTKKKLFNRRLFAEGVRQLKWIGIIGTALLVLLTVLLFTNTSVATVYSEIADTYSYNSGILQYGLGFLNNSLSLLTMLIYVVIVPVMMLRLFGFMNKRSVSDYYHGFPVRRITLYLSFGCAVLAWILIVAVVSYSAVLLADFLNRFLSGGFPQEGYLMRVRVSDLFYSYGIGLLRTICGSLLVMGAMAVAMSLTGTVFTNIITALVILLAPRLIIDMLMGGYYNMMPMVPVDNAINKIFDSSYNLFYSATLGRVTNPVIQAALNGYYFHPALIDKVTAVSDTFLWGNVIPFVYSSLLGAFYLVLGGVLFVRRKSETAGAPNVSRRIQTVFGVLVALTVTLAGTCGLARLLIHTERSLGGLTGIILMYVLGTAAYFLYEAVATRKIKSVVKSAGVFPAVILLNLVVGVFLVGSANRMMNEVTLDTEKIEAVSLDAYGVYADSSADAIPEAAEKFAKLKFTGEDLKRIVSIELYQETEAFRRSEEAYYETISSRSSDEGLMSGERVTIYYGAGKKSKPITRYLYFSDDDSSDMTNGLIEEMDQMEPVSVRLPAIKEKADYLHCGACGWDFGDEQIMELYEYLSKEMDGKKFPIYTFLGKKYNKHNVFDFIEITCTDDSNGLFRQYSLPISVSTPETVEKLAQMGNAAREDFRITDFVGMVETMEKEGTGGYARLAGILYADGGRDGLKSNEFIWSSDGYGGYTVDVENLKEMDKLLAAHGMDETPTMDGNLLFLVYGDEMGTTGHWYNLTDEEVQRLQRCVSFRVSFHRNGYNY